MVPPAGPFSSLQGAFQPKASNPLDVVSRPGSVPHQHLQKDSRLLDPMCKPKKPGKWCAMHVHIAWQVYHHQQKIKKQMQIEPHKLEFGFKPEFLNQSSGSNFVGLQPRDLPRPSTILSNAGPTHPSVSPYGSLQHTPSNLQSGLVPHHESLNKAVTFGGLTTLSSSAFGGLGNPSLTPNAANGTKDGKMAATSNGTLEPWNRLHQTPSSFPTPPLCPRPSDPERAPSVPDRVANKRDSVDNKQDQERGLKDKSNVRQLSPVRNITLENKQSTESLKASTPDEHKEEERAREKPPAQELLHQNREIEEQKHKEIHSDKKEKDVKTEQQQPAEDKPAAKESSSPKQREDLKRPNTDIQPWEPAEKKIRVEFEPHAKTSKVRVKEERRDDQDHDVTSHLKVLEKTWQGPRTPATNCSSLSTLPLPIGIPAGHPGLDRSRLVSPFLGVGPLPVAERLPYSPQHWESMRNVYRGLDLPRRDLLGKDLLMRADPLQRAIIGHPAYPREPFLQSMALEQRNHLEERQRLAFLREESERSRILAMHHSALDPHLAHPGLLAAAYPGAGLPHYSPLSRTLPAAFVHAQPHPLFPMLPARSGSPRRTNPLLDRPFSHPHRDTEAR